MNSEQTIETLKSIKQEVLSLGYKDKITKDRLQRRLEMIIDNYFGSKSKYAIDIGTTNFDYSLPMRPLKIDYTEHFHKAWEDGKLIWTNIIDIMIEEIQSFPSIKKEALSKAAPKTDSNQNRKIFIVHGHDDEMVQASARLVTKLGFDPIILREQPNQGRTIIEKFEDYSDVPFAIVLFSPDDEGKSLKETHLHKRPRQNVIFELGFFLGKLGRQNVVVLHKEVEDFEILSDFQGILFEPYHNGWELKIAKEIKAAGFEVDLNKLA